ncbi:MAG: ATPase, T2SS/T4P/T4SS family [Novosphingobium sp.]
MPGLENRQDDLLKPGVAREQAAHMRLDRIALGELGGHEAVSFLPAIATGHHGSFSTVHANSSGSALEQIDLVAIQTNIGLTLDDTIAYAASVIDVVIQLHRAGGAREIAAITKAKELVRQS